MKKILFLVSVVFISMILFACNNDQKTYTYEEVLETIEIGYADGDHIGQVTQNISLPVLSTLDKKATLSWESSNESIVHTNGTVNRPLTDTEVILILSLRVGAISRQEVYVLTVKGTQIFYTVTFDVEGDLETQSILEGLTVNEPTEAPEKQGFVFAGWYVNDTLYNFSTPVTSNLNIVAVFELIQNADYTIEFYEQRITDNTYQRLSNEVLSGTPGQMVVFNRAKEGFVINTELSILQGVVTTETPLILKVYYDRVLFDVLFKHDGELIDTIQVKFGADIETIDAPYVEMQTFIGWFFDEAFTMPLSTPFQTTEHITLYAKYELATEGSYVVNVYHENLNDDLYTLISSQTLQATFGTLVVFESSYTGFIINEGLSNSEGILDYSTPLILNVYYERIRYEVVFVDDDIVFETTVKHNGLVIQIDDLVKDGYEFVGWTRTFNSTVLYDFSSVVDSDVILYAVWNDLNIPTYEGYYASLNGLQDYQIKNQLTSIITPMNDRGYTYAITILQSSDVDPNNSNNIILVYDRFSRPKVWSSGAIGTWNREHVWPQSKLGTASDSDVHNLKPADPQTNSSRGNSPFGDDGIRTTNGYISGGTYYFPGDQDKGDIARIVLYMNVRWGLAINTGSIGDINTFLMWHIEDPVDDFERNRNNVIYTHQQNRNPFIDHPELVERIWGQVTLSSGESIQLDFYDETNFIEIRIDVYDIPSNRKREEYQM